MFDADRSIQNLIGDHFGTFEASQRTAWALRFSYRLSDGECYR